MKRFVPAIVTMTALIAPQLGLANTVEQRLLVGALSPTCAFANPITGDASYSEPDNAFATDSGKESKIDITFRSMSALYVDNNSDINQDGVNVGQQINDIDYTGSAISGAISALLQNYSGTGYNDASFVPLTGASEGTITASLDTALEMIAGFTPSLTSSYKTSYVLTCVE